MISDERADMAVDDFVQDHAIRAGPKTCLCEDQGSDEHGSSSAAQPPKQPRPDWTEHWFVIFALRMQRSTDAPLQILRRMKSSRAELFGRERHLFPSLGAGLAPEQVLFNFEAARDLEFAVAIGVE